MVGALDVGSKRIGIAISDPSQTYALPVTVIERTNIRSDIQRIIEVLKEYSVDELVVGDPVTLSGTRAQASQGVDTFVSHLQKSFSGDIHLVDERLTTAQATKAMIAADLSRAKRKSAVDKMAAALILETFLAKKRRTT